VSGNYVPINAWTDIFRILRIEVFYQLYVVKFLDQFRDLNFLDQK